MKNPILFLLTAWATGGLLLLSADTWAAPQATEPIPSFSLDLLPDDPVVFCGEKVPLEITEVRERLEKELLLNVWNRPQVILWLKRWPRIGVYIEKQLAQHGLPDDLKYLPVIESALRPHAASSKGAVGYWQFIRTTGRKYGLRIDSLIDERRNLQASTRAAIRYLKALHKRFGSWSLACAAYNMGEKGLSMRMKRQHQKNFFRLDLPDETDRYLFRLLAVREILADPGKFGFHLSSEQLYHPEPADRIKVRLQRSTDLWLIAEAAGTYYRHLKNMNPQIRSGYLGPGTFYIEVPKGAASGFNKRLSRLRKKHPKANRSRHYVVRSGDSLTGIAARHKISLSKLLRLNRLHRKSTIHPGDRLVIAK